MCRNCRTVFCTDTAHGPSSLVLNLVIAAHLSAYEKKRLSPVVWKRDANLVGSGTAHLKIVSRREQTTYQRHSAIILGFYNGDRG